MKIVIVGSTGVIEIMHCNIFPRSKVASRQREVESKVARVESELAVIFVGENGIVGAVSMSRRVEASSNNECKTIFNTTSKVTRIVSRITDKTITEMRIK